MDKEEEEGIVVLDTGLDSEEMIGRLRGPCCPAGPFAPPRPR